MNEAWEQIYGLLVEDGQIALGTLAAFAAAAAVSILGGQTENEMLRNAAGPLLFVLLMALLLVNLYQAGLAAAAGSSQAGPLSEREDAGLEA